jgi:hypothetical protein
MQATFTTAVTQEEGMNATGIQVPAEVITDPHPLKWTQKRGSPGWPRQTVSVIGPQRQPSA